MSGDECETMVTGSFASLQSGECFYACHGTFLSHDFRIGGMHFIGSDAEAVKDDVRLSVDYKLLSKLLNKR